MIFIAVVGRQMTTETLQITIKKIILTICLPVKVGYKKKKNKHILYKSSQGNQMDNQTWFDATLVKRFNECNREVTIHRANLSTLQSSAFIKAGN